VQLEDLYSRADVVSIHLRLSRQTEKMVGRQAFERMKRSALLVNTARGAIVDEAALVDALRSGRIAGAGLDVYAEEPLPVGHPLFSAPNAVLTPHSAGLSPEALEAGLVMSVTNVRDFIAGAPSNVVT